VFAWNVLAEQETRIEGEYSRELTSNGFVEWLICCREVAAMKPADARGTVREGEETGEGWAPRVEGNCEPDLNDGREEFEEIIGDADA
jgi:hypothetical protein